MSTESRQRIVILGINFSGFVAWILWWTIYLSKLPRVEKQVRVALDWLLDLLFSKDLVQYQTGRAPTMSHADNGTQPTESAAGRVDPVRKPFGMAVRGGARGGSS